MTLVTRAVSCCGEGVNQGCRGEGLMHAQLLLIGRENADVQPAWRGRVVNPETRA